MLEPRERTLLQKVLQPPEGYRLDYAIGTTFSLDLVSLLMAPLAFTLFEPESEDGSRREDSLELLESVRRYARRITMFCQAGRIAYPRSRYPQFAWLEQSVVQCRSPRGLFHPKVWVLRYTGGGSDVRYRALCLSRNLTLANSWDTLLALDGEVRTSAPAGVDPRPLADFVDALQGLATPRPSELVLARVADCASELRNVSFTPPAPFTECAFRPIGIDGYSGWPFAASRGDALVVSPFLAVPALERLASGRSSAVLISCPDTLAELPSRPKGITTFHALDEDAIVEMPPEAGEDATPNAADMIQLVGLHAKLYVFENGREAEVWTGSANATDAAFNGNIEFMVRLAGPRNRVGIGALMESDKDSLRLGEVLKDAGSSVATARRSDVEKGLEARVERARQWLGELELTGSVTAAATRDKFGIRLESVAPDVSAMPEAVTIHCWPILVGQGRAQRVTGVLPVAVFEDVSIDGLSAFIAFNVTAVEAGEKCEARFLLNVALSGLPADREDRLLRHLIRDRSRLVRFLTLLLADDGILPERVPVVDEAPSANDAGAQDQGGSHASGIFELLVRALERSPERLDGIAGLVNELTHDGSERILPEQFESIWRPIWEARNEMP